MANSDMKAKLVVEAKATGGAEIEDLAQHLQDLADEGGQAAPKLDALAQSLREAANQQQLIDGFARLKRETQDLAQAMDAATAQVDKLAQEQAQAAQAAQDAAQAQALRVGSAWYLGRMYCKCPCAKFCTLLLVCKQRLHTQSS